MNEQQVWENVKWYNKFQMFCEPLFWGPILIDFIIRVGHMPLNMIYQMEAVVEVCSIPLQIIAGALADMIGRRRTIIIGMYFLILDSILFAIIVSPLTVWVANIIWVIGFCLVSGADEALLYDSLREINQERDYTKIEGRAISKRLMLMAFSSLIAGVLMRMQVRLPMVLSVLGLCYALYCLYHLHEPMKVERYDIKEQIKKVGTSLSFVFHHPSLLWIIFFFIFLNSVSKAWFFTYNPFFRFVGLEEWQFGFIFFPLNIVAFLASRYAHLFEKKLGDSASILAMICSIGLPMLLMALFPSKLTAMLVLCQNVYRGLSRPFAGNLMHKQIPAAEDGTGKKKRATILSARYMMSGLVKALALLFFERRLKGALAAPRQLLGCLRVGGLLSLTIGAFFFVWYKKINWRDESRLVERDIESVD